MNNFFNTLTEPTFITEVIKGFAYFTEDYKVIQDFGVNEMARAKNNSVKIKSTLDTDLILRVTDLAGNFKEITLDADEWIVLDMFKLIGVMEGKLPFGATPTEGRLKIWSW